MNNNTTINSPTDDNDEIPNCPLCNGTGRDDGSINPEDDCFLCEGTGKIIYPKENPQE